MISFDELFAHRIYYQDVSFDEFYIIRKLKQILINDGMNENETNKYLYDFYINFGHNMSLEDIESVLVSSPPINQNIFTSFFNILNSQYQNNNEQEEEPLDEPNIIDSINNGSDADVEDNVLISPTNENNLDDTLDNIFDNNLDNNLDDNLSSIQDHIHIDFSLNLPNNINNINNNSEAMDNNQNHNLMQNLPNFTISNLTNLNIQPVTFEYNNVINSSNLFNQLIGQFMNAGNINNNNQEDVNITMDKNDIDNLIILKYSDDSPTNCSICLMDVCKDDYYYKIKCNHIFHRNCLEKWLEDYNYVCPVCRTELGNSKAHLEINENEEDSDSSSINSEDNV